MSRSSPKIYGGSAADFSPVKLTDSQIDKVSAACGVEVGAARNRLGEVLGWYLVSSLNKTAAPTTRDAAARLEKMQRLAAELRDLNALKDKEAPDWELRNMLRADLDCLNDAGKLLDCALENFLRSMTSVQENMAQMPQSQDDPRRVLANDLDIIWKVDLGQVPTISPSNNGSPFVRFVEAATEVLPSHWPWRPGGGCKIHSYDAFAEALRRDIHG